MFPLIMAQGCGIPIVQWRVVHTTSCQGDFRCQCELDYGEEMCACGHLGGSHAEQTCPKPWGQALAREQSLRQFHGALLPGETRLFSVAFSLSPLALTGMERRRWCWSAGPVLCFFCSWSQGSPQLGPHLYPAFGLPCRRPLGLVAGLTGPWGPLALFPGARAPVSGQQALSASVLCGLQAAQALLCASCLSPGMSYALDTRTFLGLDHESQTWAPGGSTASRPLRLTAVRLLCSVLG